MFVCVIELQCFSCFFIFSTFNIGYEIIFGHVSNTYEERKLFPLKNSTLSRLILTLFNRLMFHPKMFMKITSRTVKHFQGFGCSRGYINYFLYIVCWTNKVLRFYKIKSFLKELILNKGHLKILYNFQILHYFRDIV